MPTCPYCGHEAPTDRAMEVHQRLSCPGAKTAPAQQVEKAQEQSREQEHPQEHTQSAPAPEPARVTRQEGNFLYPGYDNNYLVPRSVADALEFWHNQSYREQINILVTGQQGCGKTSMGLQFAARYGRPCVVIDMGAYQEPQELLSSTELLEGEQGSYTRTQSSALIEGMETPGCVVLLDELNRPENERVLNPLYPFLDERAGAWIDPLKRRVNRAQGVVVWATMNEGALFAGTVQSDEAMRDRFREVPIPAVTGPNLLNLVIAKTGCPRNEAQRIVEFVTSCQEWPELERKISLRQALQVAREVANGAPFWRAVYYSIGRSYDGEWRQKVTQAAHVHLSTQEVDEWRNAAEDYTTW